MSISNESLRTIAYFTMEVGVDAALPTYSGGLGVLAGDTLKAAADAGLPMVGVTLVHRKGYVRQHIDRHGNQVEGDQPWSPEVVLQATDARACVMLQGRDVEIRAWKHSVCGVDDHEVPIYFLDSDLESNHPQDRSLTDHLYGGDGRYRLLQEALLGLGGVAILRELGHRDADVFHMNEGHSSMLTLALAEESAGERNLHGITETVKDGVRRRCVFTTHTPVPAGHDEFPVALVREVLGHERASSLESLGGIRDGVLNMTRLAMRLSRYVNGVSMRNGMVAAEMFPEQPVNAVTNGAHAVSWTSDAFRKLYDREVPEWRRDNRYLRYMAALPDDDLLAAHAHAKRELLAEVQRQTGTKLDRSAFTIGFARRATGYKRADLIFTDPERLKRIVKEVGPLQLVFAGKAHPRDQQGKRLIRTIHAAARSLADDVKVVYLEDYDMRLGRLLCAGVDLWLNNPQKPLEASGTSGMKAALNGVPCLSVLDGWWIEGCVEGVTGWAIGDEWDVASDTGREVQSLYDQLENVIMPMFYKRPYEYARVMRNAISLNGSFFTAQRMLSQYVDNAYLAQATAPVLAHA